MASVENAGALSPALSKSAKLASGATRATIPLQISANTMVLIFLIGFGSLLEAFPTAVLSLRTVVIALKFLVFQTFIWRAQRGLQTRTISVRRCRDPKHTPLHQTSGGHPTMVWRSCSPPDSDRRHLPVPERRPPRWKSQPLARS